MKLLFCDHSDIYEPWGSVRFGASDFANVQAVPTLPFAPSLFLRQEDGSYEVWGHFVATAVPWQIYRARTRDGITFEDVRVVHDEPGTHWGYSARLLYSPELGRFIYTKNTSRPDGHEMYIYHSDDGESWQAYDGNPVFNEGDAWGGIWSSVAMKFLMYQKGIQRYEHKGVNEMFLNARRVLTIRASDDGFTWTPDIASDYKRDMSFTRGMRTLTSPLITPDYQLDQNELDPPDLEFYNGSPYEYEGRYFMVVNLYSGSFTEPGFSPVRSDGHGSGGSLGNELWTSRDGLNWERPAQHGGRGGGGVHNPLLAGNRILIRTNTALTGVPADRLTYVSSWSNSHFLTASFVMGTQGLAINAKIPGEVSQNDGNAAYVMCELVDDRGQVVDGYDREQCSLTPPLDLLHHPLRWAGKDGSDLAGERLRLRIYLRTANVYAITSPDAVSAADTTAGGAFVPVTPRPH